MIENVNLFFNNYSNISVNHSLPRQALTAKLKSAPPRAMVENIGVQIRQENSIMYLLGAILRRKRFGLFLLRYFVIDRCETQPGRGAYGNLALFQPFSSK